MLDLDFSIVYISPSIQKMSGFGPEELTGRSFTQLLEPDHARRFTQEITQELEHPNGTKEGVREMELCQLNKAGTSTWIEIRVSLVSSEDGPNKKILGISRDITERKEAEKEKKQMESQLFQAQKMESIGTLAGGVAHDFNNLLTVINGYAELIQAKLEEDHPLTPKVQAISHAGQRAENLTRQLLAFSRKQIFKPEIISLNQTIKSMDQMLRRLIGEDIHVQTIASKGIGPISADQNQIEQVFTNLIVNARDALSGPGSDKIKKRITIETGETLLNLKEAQKRGLDQEGKYIFFSVSDNGQGMDLETQKRIFEPFFTTKSKYQGTGLGMAMIYGIIKQNKGSIRVYSEPNQGSVFKIYWPASSPKKTLPARDCPPENKKKPGRR
ncbi:MAG: PAS domain S-box protein [Desulfobacter sp.]|nr:PAS domain S-box protein [Desulfobacter sp.]